MDGWLKSMRWLSVHNGKTSGKILYSKIPHCSSNVGLHYHGPSTHTGAITCCWSEEMWWMDGWWKEGKEGQPACNASHGSKLPVSAIFWWDFSLEAYTEHSSGNITGLIKMIGMGRFSCQWRERELFQGNHCSDQRTIVFVWKQVLTAASGSHVFIFNPGPVACYIFSPPGSSLIKHSACSYRIGSKASFTCQHFERSSEHVFRHRSSPPLSWFSSRFVST